MSYPQPFTCFDGFWGAHCGLPYPPPPPLPLPAALPPIPPGVEAGELKHLGIMTAEEEMSNSQLEFHVRSSRIRNVAGMPALAAWGQSHASGCIVPLPSCALPAVGCR